MRIETASLSNQMLFPEKSNCQTRDKSLAASFVDGRLKLAKAEPGSAVFLVRFVPQRGEEPIL